MITVSEVITNVVQLTKHDMRVVEAIAKHTKNTWQKNRPLDEIRRDTAFGKLAERSFMDYLEENDIPYVDWDSIRQDNYERHTALDGFVARTTSVVDLHSNEFASEVHDGLDGAYLSSQVRNELEHNGVASYEVKSTRIGPRHMTHSGSANYHAILRDDFLAYPIVREGILTPELRQRLLQATSKNSAAQRSPLILVRVYVSPPDEWTAATTAHLIGWIDRDSFYENCTVKTMPQPGKSEMAIYYAVALKDGRPMSELQHFIEGT